MTDANPSDWILSRRIAINWRICCASKGLVHGMIEPEIWGIHYAGFVVQKDRRTKLRLLHLAHEELIWLIWKILILKKKWETLPVNLTKA